MRVHVALVALLAGCTGAPSPAGPSASQAPTVKALSYPVGYLAQRIAGARVQVETVLPAGEDAPFWQPDGELIASLADADLIVANGAGYEAWTATATLPSGKLVDTTAGLDLISIDGPTHSHGKAGEHSHQGTDPHTWTDPAVYALQARAVHAALVRVDPEGKVLYDANLGGLERNLAEVGESLDAALAPAKGRPMIANHPSFSYLARRAGLAMDVVDLDPSAAAPEGVLGERPTEGLVLWWEAIPTPEARGSLPEGIQHIYVDPLEQPGPDGKYEYVAQMRANIVRMQRSFPPVAEQPPGDGTAPEEGSETPAGGE